MHPEDNYYELSPGILERLPLPSFVVDPGSVRDQLAALSRNLHRAAGERAQQAPAQILARWDRTSREGLIDLLAAAQQREVSLLREMVRDQEDLDWLVYSALGLEGVTFEPSRGTALPEQRPANWLSEEAPGALDPALTKPWTARRRTISASPLIGMLEQAMYKRPFRHASSRVATDFEVQVQVAADRWLADRVEDVFRSSKVPRCLSIAEIVRQLDRGDVRAVCSLGDARLERRLEDLLSQNAVPHLPALRYTESGITKRAAWTRAWEEQRREDAAGALDPFVSATPAYASHDFVTPTLWRLRGKLDVPRERFILYPAAGEERDARFGWGGWSCHERGRALVDLHEMLKSEGADVERRLALLSGVLDLLPRLERSETTRGERGTPTAAQLRVFIDTEAKQLDLSLSSIRAWRPSAPARRAGKRERT
jgi:hypothetical protein